MSKRLGDVLVIQGVVARADVEGAAAAARVAGRRIGELLLERGFVDERDLYRALAERWGARFDDAEALFPRIEPEMARKLPRRFTEQAAVLPICSDDTGVLVAATDPTLELRELESGLGKKLHIVVVTPTDLLRLRAAVDLGQLSPTARPAARSGKDLLHGHRFDAELVGLFDAVLLDAIAQRASDIHLEIYGERPRVRFRIDGDLHDAPRYQLTPAQHRGVISVLKVGSELDIAEHRLPQSGRFSVHAGGRAFDVRVQTQPSLHGEHAVLRLLPQGEKLLTIAGLGFPPPLAAAYERLLRLPGGLVLVVGPTGSGKSTTLYAGLQVLAADTTRKVISVEDPVEYALDGIQQVVARSDLGFGFAAAMRAFVREDPDVILVGEIRDGETALEALRASQTGHLVLSTLHCNDAVDAVQRLRDLGMHKNSIAAELQAVFAQRLAKRICPGCKVAARADAGLFAEVFGDGDVGAYVCFRGSGCDRCGGTGSLGRIAVVEHLPTGPRMRSAIAAELALDELREVARQSGLVGMRQHALALVADGVIAFDELRWLLPPEQLARG